LLALGGKKAVPGHRVVDALRAEPTARGVIVE
jgi:hypothetical protein